MAENTVRQIKSKLVHQKLYVIGHVLQLGIVELQVCRKDLAFVARKSQGAVEIGLKLRALQ